MDAALVIGAGCDLDEVDQAVEQGARQLHCLAIAGDNLRHAVDLPAIVLDDGGMRDHRFDDRQVGLVGQQRFAARGQFIGARLQLVGRDAGDDRVGDAFFGQVDFGQLPIDVGAARDQAAAFIGPGDAEFVEIGGDDIGMEKVALDRRPDPTLQDRVGYGRAVAAGSSLAVGAAAPAVGRDDDDRPAARGAAQLAREQAGLPLALGMVAAGGVQALLDLRPGRGVDDLKFGNRLTDLFAGGIDAGNPLPAVGVFPEGLPIIDDFAQIKAVVQDAVPALAVADDGVRPPLPAAGRRDAFRVQALRDRGRALSGGVVFEDAADDGGLSFVDLAQPAFGLSIGGEGEDLAKAIGQPARDAPSADPADMAAPDLVGQLFEKQRRHRAAQPDMHRTDFAFGKGDDARAGEADALEDAGQVFLVARYAVQALGQQDGSGAAVDGIDRGLQAWAVADGSADRGVGLFADDPPAFAIGALSQQAQLVFDGILRLQRGRIAGVKDGIGHLRGAESFKMPAIMARARALAKLRAKAIASGLAGGRSLSLQLIRARAGRSVTPTLS